MQNSSNQRGVYSRWATETHNPFRDRMDNEIRQNSRKPRSPFNNRPFNSRPFNRSPLNRNRQDFSRDFSMSTKNNFRMSDATMRPATPSPNKNVFGNVFPNHIVQGNFPMINGQDNNPFRSKRLTMEISNNGQIQGQNPFQSMQGNTFPSYMPTPNHNFNQQLPCHAPTSISIQNPFQKVSPQLQVHTPIEAPFIRK